jgi:hypothetical protein
MGTRRCAYRALVGKPERRSSLERPSIVETIIFEKWDEIAWTGSIWLRIGTGGGLL